MSKNIDILDEILNMNDEEYYDLTDEYAQYNVHINQEDLINKNEKSESLQEKPDYDEINSESPEEKPDKEQNAKLNKDIMDNPGRRPENPYVEGESPNDSELKIYDIYNEDYMKYIYNCYITEEADTVFMEHNDPKLWSIFTEDISYVNMETTDINFSLIPEDQEKNKELKVNSQIQSDTDRYEDVTAQITEVFDPDINISTSYLWKNPQYKNQLIKDTASNFQTGCFPVSPFGLTYGKLLDGSRVKVGTLIDSGASKPMLNKKFYNNSPFLQKYPIYKIKPRYMKVANSNLLAVKECIHMLIEFGGFVFETIAYLVDMLADYDFVVGQKFMYELEGGIDFGNLNFHFCMKTVNLYSDNQVQVLPGQKKIISLKLGKCPADMKECEQAIIRLKHKNAAEIPAILKVPIKQGIIQLEIENLGKTNWIIRENEMMGCVDMRSMGYFHVSRDSLQLLLDQCEFLDETKSYNFVKDTFGNHIFKDKMCTACVTRLKHRKNKPGIIEDPVCDVKPNNDPYPWLDKDDPRRFKTDEQLIRELVDLTDSHITKEQKEDLIQILIEYRDAFSLRDEIGTCPHMEVELELTDTTPFFIRPFPIAEAEKVLVDKEMKKGVLLGILKKSMSSYSSPIMLIPRKMSDVPRIVTDFRYLNSRLKVLNPSIPLVRDAIQMIGASGCEILSVIDLRDAYHTLRLSPRSQQFCGITPFYGSDTYIYTRLAMGLATSPSIWSNYISTVLGQIPKYGNNLKDEHIRNYLCIMDDIIVFGKMKDHNQHLINLFKALVHQGLKISPKKCQLWKKKCVYMGHYMMIEGNVPCITPLKTRLEAIEKLGPLKTPKNCKQFCGMVNYVSMYLQDLQTTLIPIYRLTRKGMPFHWGPEEQQAYDKVKKALVTPPVLVMPNLTGHYILVTDTSKIGCGAALYQDIRDRYRLVAYYSKKLPEACSRYSISELEFTGLVACISAFKHLLKNVNFTIYVDHSALVHILKGKREPPTLRLKKLLEIISQYSFDIKYLKGKEMYISDFLSRHPDNDDGSPYEIIPISFLSMDTISLPSRILSQNLQNFDMINSMLESHVCEKCMIFTRSKSKTNNQTPTPISQKQYPSRKSKTPDYFGFPGKSVQSQAQNKILIPHKVQEGKVNQAAKNLKVKINSLASKPDKTPQPQRKVKGKGDPGTTKVQKKLLSGKQPEHMPKAISKYQNQRLRAHKSGYTQVPPGTPTPEQLPKTISTKVQRKFVSGKQPEQLPKAITKNSKQRLKAHKKGSNQVLPGTPTPVQLPRMQKAIKKPVPPSTQTKTTSGTDQL